MTVTRFLSRSPRLSGRAFVLALAASAALLTGPVAQAADTVRFQTDWLPSGEHAMYYGGWEKGFFAQEGIDITIVRGYGPSDTVAKAPTGSFDFGVADASSVLTARARQGLPVKSIAVIYSHSPHSLFVLKDSGIGSLKDLEGKRIGAPAGNSHRVYFPAVAAKAGVRPERVNWVTMDAAALGAQLIAGNVDAIPLYTIHLGALNDAARKAGKEVVALPYVDAGFKIYAATIIASDKVLAEKPDLTRRFLKAVKHSFEWARDNPEEACRAHVRKVPEVGYDVCLISLKATLPFVFNAHEKEFGWGGVSPERLAATWAAVAQSQGLDPAWNPAQGVDTSFLPAR